MNAFLFIQMVYTFSFATLLFLAGIFYLHWSPLVAVAAWLLAFVLSFVPILRELLIALVLLAYLPWWGAIIVAVAIGIIYHFLLTVTKPDRKEQLKEQQEKIIK